MSAEERTPDSGQRAIEDREDRKVLGEERQVMEPKALGPAGSPGAAMNPFWSDYVRAEANLRALRPASLPPDPSLTAEVALVSPPREQPDLQGAMLRGVMEENARLWAEIEKVKAMFMSSGGPHGGSPGFGPPGMGMIGTAPPNPMASNMLSWLGGTRAGN